MSIETDIQQQLLAIAERSIAHGLKQHAPYTPDAEQLANPIKEDGACFVTLHKAGELRGCIGSLEAQRPLYQDVAENAYAAAFRDPRFPPLREQEWSQLTLDISILLPASPIDAVDEEALLEQLRPGVDGLILQQGSRRATFLPSVWEMVPKPQEFLAHLKMKAGFSIDHWSEQMRFYRYETESFSRAVTPDLLDSISVPTV